MCVGVMQSSSKHAVRLSPWYALDHEVISMSIAGEEDGFHEQVDVHTQAYGWCSHKPALPIV